MGQVDEFLVRQEPCDNFYYKNKKQSLLSDKNRILI